jgi:hypothetical protein
MLDLISRRNFEQKKCKLNLLLLSAAISAFKEQFTLRAYKFSVRASNSSTEEISRKRNLIWRQTIFLPNARSDQKKKLRAKKISNFPGRAAETMHNFSVKSTIATTSENFWTHHSPRRKRWWWWWGASQDGRGLIQCCEEWVILPVARKWWRGLRYWSLGKTQYFVCKHCLSSDLSGVFIWYRKTYDVIIHAHAGCKLTSSYVKLHSRGICVIFGSGSGGSGFWCCGGISMYQFRADWRRRPWRPWLVVCIVNGIQQ